MKEIRKNVFHIAYKNQYLLTSTMVRLQEFYECPNYKFRGKYFTHEQFMDWNSSKNEKGEFDYFDQVEGCNIPDYAVKNFVKVFKGKLWTKEKKMLDKLSKIKGKYYLIGTYKGNGEKANINHELAHAYYYLYPEYKKQMKKLVSDESDHLLSCLYSWLHEAGYCFTEMADEAQAYLATSNKSFWDTVEGDPSGKVKEYFKKFNKGQK